MIMKKKPFLSILIPTRNRARYVGYAVQSAINIQSDDIEILVSENHSQDNTKAVLASYSDHRLRVISPDSPLPMHENWEFLLAESSGEWVYFLGDDDAMMAHAVEHLRKVVNNYPRVEAIVSPRAYYFWDGVQDQYGDTCLSVNFSAKEVWRDSKKMLAKCIDGDIDYLSLPQCYSGGFQRRTLINRIKRSQSGIYFKSVTPDAYSALAAVIHTFRYLEIGVPLAWVGSSPHRSSKTTNASEVSKDRNADFTGMHSEDKLTLSYPLGEFKNITFTLCFYEACISAFPNTAYSLMSQKMLKRVFFHFCFKHGQKSEAVDIFAQEIGFSIPVFYSVDYFYFLLKKKISIIFVKVGSLANRIYYRPHKNIRTSKFKSGDHIQFPNILAFDDRLAQMYEDFEKSLLADQNKK